MQETNRTRRVAVLTFFVAVLTVVMSARLYNLQIVHGADYLKQSERKISRVVTVESSRGEILDRYGRPLVTNRLSYNLGIDTVTLPKEGRNDILLSLIQTVTEFDKPYTDTMPISFSMPFQFTEEDESTFRKRFRSYAEAMDWPEDVSALEAVYRMRDYYGIDETVSDEDARKIVGVRYEIDLRSTKVNLNIPSYVFATDVSAELIGAIKERGHPGVSVLTETVRRYETDFAAHLLGRVGPIYEDEYEELKELGYALDDTVGKDGAEKAFEEWLRGEAGSRLEEYNTSGKVTNVVTQTPPEPGANVMLTIDIRLQEAAERALKEAILNIRELGEQGSNQGAADVEGGAAVVIDVKTGEILAMASYPTFSLETFNQDFNDLNQDPTRPMYNRALMGQYAPGSTYKMITATAALETGIITDRTRITDRGIYTYYAPTYTPRCELYLSSGGTHGSINVADALKVSCNYFFYEIGRLTGIETLSSYASQFGIGELTGVELAGERKGTLAGPADRESKGKIWNPGDTIQSAIGQSDNLVTPLQLANYVATLVNGGTRNQAHLLKSVKSFDYAQTLYDAVPEPLGTVDISDKTLGTVLSGMRLVSTDGSASAVFRNYAVATGSKTGTAQTGNGSPNGTFVAFAPYDDPEIAVAVIVEKAGKGSRIAGVARDIFDAYFRTGSSLSTVPAENELIN